MAAWGKNPPRNGNNVTPVEYQETAVPSGASGGYGPDPRPDESGVIRPLIKHSEQLPYRGSEYHGVNPNLAGEPPDINTNVFDMSAVVPEKQAAPERAEVPVPVRIVHDDDSYEYTNGRTTGSILSGTPITVVSHMRHRTNLIITNNGTQPILISDSQQPYQANSVTIAVGGSFTTTAKNRFYGVSSDGSPQLISILEEYTISADRKPAW